MNIIQQSVSAVCTSYPRLIGIRSSHEVEHLPLKKNGVVLYYFSIPFISLPVLSEWVQSECNSESNNVLCVN